MDKYLMKTTPSRSKTPLSDDLLESLIKFGEQNSSPSNFKNFVDEKRGLNVDLDSKFLNSNLSRKLLQFCEQNFVYNSGRDAQIKIFNRLIDIPRKQTAFGDMGLTYKFSGTIVPAKLWTQEIRELKNLVSKAAGCQFNFVLVNR
uniref:Uncharacterized protein n=1 Tax=Romanomermis culicivorax TaxID=13658 RepID=A0A915I2B5_ROMCU